ncbi:exodeoxyribonuclease I [gamma proteobacterium HTCC5015]|nr:exodeoxyribonuclease I [gamma proteobacterium HTCC5015]
MSQTFYWYDLETFGTDPKTTRIAQFAGQRTDADLNPIGDPLVIYCQPSPDFLPDPEACLITGITPQVAAREGLPESEFIQRIHREFSQPNTCVLGYNSLRFDDEFMRYGFYRNFIDPYAREWQNGCSRWDLIDVVRLTRALRPEGIEWPFHEDGTPSNKLEDLTQANGLVHSKAHDAYSDIEATIAVAKRIKEKQPKLWQFCLHNRDKRKLAGQLKVAAKEPVVHISGMYGNERASTAIVVPVARHPSNKNGIIVYDLAHDPAELIALDSAAIAERVFTRREDLGDKERLPLKTVHLNKCPVIAPLSTLSEEAAQRLGIDIEEQVARIETLKPIDDLEQRVQAAFGQQQFDPITDPDQSLYGGGFIGDSDKALMRQIHSASPEQLSNLDLPFQDKRLPELLFRFRARNYPMSLDSDEQQRWAELCREHIHDGKSGYLNLDQFQNKLMALAQEYEHDDSKLHVLKQLADYVEHIA